MDNPACDKRELRRTLERFRLINRLVSGWGRAYRSQLRPVLAELQSQGQVDSRARPEPQIRSGNQTRLHAYRQRPIRILDIGCGGGDVLRRIVRLARRDGFEVEALGIDVDPTAIAVAQSHQSRNPVSGLTFRQATSRDLVAEGARFNIVISNHLIHHLGASEHSDAEPSGSEFTELFADSARLAIHLCVHSDIARHRLAYAAYALLAAPLTIGTFAYTDGLRSIRRSYTHAELVDLLPSNWRVERATPFRLLAVLKR
ncbi:methyltransferase domain-containing protein [Leucobacter denitrificans]|uniref:Methyltransferase domain-containing protein n=2 Tax=Leucobacter denitrificans TaxID=683042 RepID=A0A7G9S7P6_9MICO|nr:methyltransferase domain-containing protein [Leucobacter denitrificans]